MATTNVHISLHLSKIQNQHPVLTTALDGYAGRRDSQRSRPRGETLSAKTRPFADKTLIHLHLSVKTPLFTDKLWGGTGLSGPKRFLADKRVMNGDLSAGMRLLWTNFRFRGERLDGEAGQRRFGGFDRLNLSIGRRLRGSQGEMLILSENIG